VRMAGGVFINYRGVDSRSYGALLYTELSRYLGAERVFLDSESIPAGADFVQELLARVRGCRVLLAVIGPRWLVTAGAEGRQIDDPADWVRRELVEAFAAGVRVIPVLTDDADLPAEVDLPAQIGALGRCQYRRLRHREATTDLERLRADIAADPVLRAAARRQARISRPDMVPAQLPADVYGFAGRTAHLNRLDTLLAGAAVEAPTAVVITAVSGTAGVGKTALAVHWAHRVREWFPDGQLYVNLRGFDTSGRVTAPGEAVRGFLDALGVPAQRIPSGLDAQAALYRSVLVGKRLLVLLDNARDAEQVRPLLPGEPGCLVIVTSRNQLTTLVTGGAHALTVDLLDPVEAKGLLARRLGADRVAAEPGAVDEIITRCVRLPLALTIAAARAAARPTFLLSTVAGELADAGRRLDALDTGDPAGQVRAVFSWSYATLAPGTAQLFRLLGLHPGPDISAAAAASLADRPLAEVRRLLTELTRASLLVEHAPGRYTTHDLLKEYAAQLGHGLDPDRDRRVATRRLLDHYLHTAQAAAGLLDPHRRTPAVMTPAPSPAAGQPGDYDDALTWFITEHTILLAAVGHAARTGFDTHTWKLAWAIDPYLLSRGGWNDMAVVWTTALAATLRLGDPRLQALAYENVGWAHTLLGEHATADAHYVHALRLHAQTHDHDGLADAQHALTVAAWRQGHPGQALNHASLALALHQATNDRPRQAVALHRIGWCHALLGSYRHALACCEEALTLHQQLGDHHREAGVWDSLGYVHHLLGDHPAAIDCYRHALDLRRHLGLRHPEAITHIHLGNAHHAAANPTAARTAWQQALDILDNLNHTDAHSLRVTLADPDLHEPAADPVFDRIQPTPPAATAASPTLPSLPAFGDDPAPPLPTPH